MRSATRKKRKAKVKLGMCSLSIPDKLERGRVIISAMSGAQEFSMLKDEIVAAEMALERLREAKEKKEIAAAEARAAKVVQDHKERSFDEAFKTLARQVEHLSDGEAAIIQKAGLGGFFPGGLSGNNLFGKD